MSTISSPIHPSWCSPECCKPHLFDDGSVSYEHREAATTFIPAGQCDVEITMRRTQLADFGAFPGPGNPTVVTLQVVETASSHVQDGPPIIAEADMTAVDLRTFAAVALMQAEVLEAQQRAATTERGVA